MKTKLTLLINCIFSIIFFYGCDTTSFQFETKNEDFNVKSFVSNIKSFNKNAEYINNILPSDTSSLEKPYISVQSGVIKGKDMLISITVPIDAEEIYIGATNAEEQYFGLYFNGQSQDSVKGYYRLKLGDLKSTYVESNGNASYSVVLSTNENIQLDKFNVVASCKTSNGISNQSKASVGVSSIAPYQKTLKVGFIPLTGYSYSISVNTPKGNQITYSYDKSSGSESYNPSQYFSFDSGLGIKWINLDPDFGRYSMNATIQIDIDYEEETQYVCLNMIIITEGKIDQTNLNANIQQTSDYTAVGYLNANFSYFDNYSVVMQPIWRDGYARIPKGDKNAQTIRVTVDPDPMRQGDVITLTLETISGTGSAKILNSENPAYKEITGTTDITIVGVENSSEKKNILLKASYKGNKLAEQKFTVRTWPTNFHQISVMQHKSTDKLNSNDQLAGILQFKYQWESESENISDLEGIKIGEEVYFHGEIGDIFYFSNPPYRLGSTDNPTIINHIIGQTPQDNIIVWNEFGDTHRIPTTKPEDMNDLDVAFTKGLSLSGFNDYCADGIKATQYYRFKDDIIMDSEWIYFSGKHEINNAVYKNTNGLWEYICEKDGYISNRILPNQ
jgi:hypothetical protein